MAVKGKGKHKGKARQVARPPRARYTPPPTPLVGRRWVQVLGAFLAGIAVVLVALWVVNGLSSQREDRQRREAASAAASAMTQVQGRLDPVLQQVGQPVPPSGFDAFPRIREVTAAAQDGKAKSGEIDLTAKTTASTAGDAVDLLKDVDVADILRDKGVDQLIVTNAIAAVDQIEAALVMYGLAADSLAASQSSAGSEQQRLVDETAELVGRADALFVAGYSSYVQAQEAAGVFTPDVPSTGQPPLGATAPLPTP